MLNRLLSLGWMLMLIPSFLVGQSPTDSACDQLTITSTNNITISGLTYSNTIIKIFNEGWQQVFECNANCEETVVFEEVSDGSLYRLDIQIYNDQWEPICNDRPNIRVSGDPIPPPNPCGTVCQGDLILESQADVDAVCGCDVIDGDVIIGTGPNNITNIEKLFPIKEVRGDISIIGTQLLEIGTEFSFEKIDGDITIMRNPNLINLVAMNQVTTLQNVTIASNPNLLEINGFQGTITVNDLRIIDNPNLESSVGFLFLRKANSYFFHNNNSIENFFSYSLTEITSTFSVKSNAAIPVVDFPVLAKTTDFLVEDNARLTKIKKAESIIIDNNLKVVQNPLLTDCCFIKLFLDNNQIGGAAEIAGNGGECASIEAIFDNCGGSEPPVSACDQLTITSDNNITISGLTHSNTIIKIFNEGWKQVFECNANCEETVVFEEVSDGSLYRLDIQIYNDQWESICNDRPNIRVSGDPIPPPNPCGTVCQGDMILESQADVDAVCGCDVIDGDLIIGTGPNNITNIEKLFPIKEVRGDISIIGTQLVVIGTEFSSEKIDGNISIMNNPNLTTFFPMNQVTTLQNVTIASNPNLLFLGAFQGAVIANDLRIIDNPNLETSSGFVNLKTANSYFFHNNNSIENFFSYSLTEITSTFSVKSNAAITIVDFPLLVKTTDFLVEENASLNKVKKSESIIIDNNLKIVQNPLLTDCCFIKFFLDNNQIGGATEIAGNGGNCGSIEAIFDNCEDPEPPVSPCDANEVTYQNNTLEITGLVAAVEIVKVFDQHWQEVYTCYGDCDENITISNANSSVYHVQISNYTSGWGFICSNDQDISIAGSRNRTLLLAEDFSLTPNPAGEEVFVDLKELVDKEVTLRMVNQFGQEVYNKVIPKVTTEKEPIDLSAMSNGIYFIQIQSKNRRSIGKKLMVTRLY